MRNNGIYKKKIESLLPHLKTPMSKILELRKYILYKYYTRLEYSRYKNIIEYEYKKIIGEKLDWNKLQTYNEKMQWAKLYDENPLKTKLSDKYLVRKWVKNKIGKQYLIPIYGTWEKFDQINFDELPEKFVLKTNHGSGTNIIVKDKKLINSIKLRRTFHKWLKLNFAFYGGIEPHYKNIQPRIIAEKYLEDKNGQLTDFKFLCFNGEVYYCWVDVGRFENHRRNVYDLNWRLQPWNQYFYPNTEEPLEKPKNFELMKRLAKVLSEGFSHVRVDLYNVDGKIYFGEMTFTNGRGYEEINPKEYNVMLGELWELPGDFH